MPRKGRFEFEPENTAPDGHYIVGKGRPPEHGKFRAGDGRKRGRRPRGTKNLATDLKDELESAVSVTVSGVARKVSRQRAIVMRMADNAIKGQTSAIALTFDYQQKLVDPLHQRDEQSRESKARQDFSNLSYSELKILRFLMRKAQGIEDAYPGIIGVLPIFAPGHYIGDREKGDVEAGLKAYGIEMLDCRGGFPPESRLIGEKSDAPIERT